MTRRSLTDIDDRLLRTTTHNMQTYHTQLGLTLTLRRHWRPAWWAG